MTRMCGIRLLTRNRSQCWQRGDDESGDIPRTAGRANRQVLIQMKRRGTEVRLGDDNLFTMAGRRGWPYAQHRLCCLQVPALLLHRPDHTPALHYSQNKSVQVAAARGMQMKAEQLNAIEHFWRNRPAPVYLYDRERGLMN